MATAYSSNLALALPVTGELSGTWGTTVNTQITNMLDEALGYQTFSATGSTDTLTIPDGTTGVARSIYIQLNGTGGGTVTVPTAKTKMYFVFNNTSSAITFKVTGQTGVSIPAAAKMALFSNGADIFVAENYFSALTLGAALPVASGGTGLASGTSGGVLAYTATGTLASSTALAASALVIGGGAGAAPSTTTTGTGVVTALGVNTGSAGAFVVNGGALGSPSSVGTMPAFTLGGTVSGGGNQINNVIIGTTTPLAGAFTTLSATDGTRSYAIQQRATAAYNGLAVGVDAGVTTSAVLNLMGGLNTGGTAGGVNVAYYAIADGQWNRAITIRNVSGTASTAVLGLMQEGGTTTAGGALTIVGTLSGGTSGTGYSFSGSAPATSLTLDSSGNLGLGVTPSAWRTDAGPAKAVQLPGGSVWAFGTQEISLGQNYYYGASGGRYRLVDGKISNYFQSSGEHYWQTSVTGLAGVAATNIDIMTLDSSGNLGLGVTPSAWNTFTASFQIAGASLSGLGNNNTALASNAYYNTGWKYYGTASTSASLYQQNAGQHAWSIAPAGTAGASAAVTSGQSYTVSVLGSSTLAQWQAFFSALTVLPTVGQVITATATGSIVGGGTVTQNISFTQAMTLDASGNLLVGTTSGSYHTFNKSSSVALMEMNNSNASPVGLYITFNGASPNGTANEFLTCRDTTTNRAIIRSNGGIANYSANDVNLSDRREKTNFAPAKSYLDKICAIPVQTFNYIDQNLEEDGGLTLGVVAQDVQAVAPELVSESNWAKKDDEPRMRLSIYQTDLQYALMKCIQEQQVLITQLTARITALETA